MGLVKDKTEEDYERDFEYICLEIENGIPLRKACKVFMSLNKFYKILEGSADKRERYVRACDIRAETMFEDILDIADDSSGDTYTDDEGNEKTDQEAIQRSRLRVDARKWMLSKLAPKKYGDKIEVDANINAKVETVTIFKLPDNGR